MEYQDWVFEEWQEYGGDTLMEEMDNPVKWEIEPGYYPHFIGYN